MNPHAPVAPGTLYIECTATVIADRVTGIQRVVRNVVRHAAEAAGERGVRVQPVYFAGTSFYPAHLTEDGTLVPTPDAAAKAGIQSRARRNRFGAANFARKGLPGDWIQRWSARAPTSGLVQGMFEAWRWLRRVRWARRAASLHAPVTFAPGDTILSVDVTLDKHFVRTFPALRVHGVQLASVVYDLAPIRFPDQVPARFRADFRRWVDCKVASCDLVIAISTTVRDDVADYFAGLAGAARPAGPRIAWFHLGRDLDRALPDGGVREPLTRIFGAPESGTVFLMVGWLHPRKNHLFALEAMERLHREGIPARLVVIGRREAAAAAFHRRVAADAGLAGRVFVFHDATDTELAYCYRRASALIFPSISEGFGLPLVEALGHGLRVFASDIPVFREIGEGFVSFFPLDDPEVLAGKLRSFCVDGHFDASRAIADFKWPTWRDSVDALLDIVLDIVLEPDDAKAMA
jgi:alpha-1,2-rhamnosyltransferase